MSDTLNGNGGGTDTAQLLRSLKPAIQSRTYTLQEAAGDTGATTTAADGGVSADVSAMQSGMAKAHAQITGQVSLSDVLRQIRKRESGGDYSLTPQQNMDYPRSHASGAYQFQPGTWQSWTKASGIGTEYDEAYKAPPNVQDAVAAYAAVNGRGVNDSSLWKNDKYTYPQFTVNDVTAEGLASGVHSVAGAAVPTNQLTMVGQQAQAGSLGQAATAAPTAAASTNALAPTAAATTATGGVDPSKLMALALMQRMVSGTHNLVPVNYDPFKATPMRYSGNLDVSRISAPQVQGPSGQTPSGVSGLGLPGGSVSLSDIMSRVVGSTGKRTTRSEVSPSTTQYGTAPGGQYG